MEQVSKSIIKDIQVEVVKAETVHLPSAADCNTPCWWSSKGMNILTSTGHPRHSSGPDLASLVKGEEITYTSWRDGGRWIEAVHQEEDGVLIGWFHNEPAHYIAEEYQVGRQFPMTSPFIGAAVSYDDGHTWDDLGLIISGGEDTLNLSERNYWFAGGNGDFSVILDRKREYFYFLISTYYREISQQGISLARLPYSARFSPVGKVEKWCEGGWHQKGLGGSVTPVFPVNSGWYSKNPDAYWGPSVHWNADVQKYVILMNHAIDPRWKGEGIYISVADEISMPETWSKPVRILETEAWYPQVLNGEADKRWTDRESGERARLFIHGHSSHEIIFSQVRDERA